MARVMINIRFSMIRCTQCPLTSGGQ